MYIAEVHIRIKPDRVDDFMALIEANHRASIDEPGCLRFDVARSKTDPTEFRLWEVYVDEAAAAEHKTTRHYLAFRANVTELQAEDRFSELFEGVFVGPVA
jgi:autoinducer 2-degrading protein